MVLMEFFSRPRGAYTAKSQAAVEMTVILAVALIIFLFIFAINRDASTAITGQFESGKAKNAVEDIAQASILVYQQGVGAKTRLFITMPDTVNFVNISDNIILINLYSGGHIRDVYRTLDFAVSGSLGKDGGSRWVDVEAFPGYVYITDNVTIS